MRVGLLLMNNILTSLAKSVMVPLALTKAASATAADIKEKRSGSGTTAQIVSNEEMDDILKIVKSLKESGLLIKSVSEWSKNEAKQQKGVIRGSEVTVRGGQDF